jgi:hypothetical protein
MIGKAISVTSTFVSVMVEICSSAIMWRAVEYTGADSAGAPLAT